MIKYINTLGFKAYIVYIVSDIVYRRMPSCNSNFTAWNTLRKKFCSNCSEKQSDDVIGN